MTNIQLKVALPVGATGGRWELIPDVPTVNPSGTLSVTTAWGLISTTGDLKGQTLSLAAAVTLPTQAGTFGTLRILFKLPGSVTMEGLPIRVALKETAAGVMDIPTLINATRAAVVTPPLPNFTPVPAAPIVIVPPVDPPPVVTPVPAITARANDVLLTWPAVPNAISYYVLRQRRTGGQWFMVSGFLNSPAWTDQGLPDGAAATYKVMVTVGSTLSVVATLSATQLARTWEAPITITQPGTYTGHNWRSTDPNIPAVTVQAGVQGVIIQGFRVRAGGTGIKVGTGADVVIQDGAGFADHPGVANTSNGKFVDGVVPKGITLQRTVFEGWTFGLYVDGQSTQTVQRIVFERNISHNMNCLRTTLTGYQQVKHQEGHVFIASNCFRVANYSDQYNASYQEYQVGLNNDAHNNYNSSGTSTSTAKMQWNLVYGLWPMDGTADPHTDLGASSGCAFISDGALLSDQTMNGYLIISDNWAIATSNCGVGIATGQNIEVARNRVGISGYLPDGVTVNRATNVGIYVRSMSGGTLANVSVHDNVAQCWGRPGSLNQPGNTYYNNPYDFTAIGSNGNVQTGNTQVDSPGTVQREYDEHLGYWQAMKTAGITLGVQVI